MLAEEGSAHVALRDAGLVALALVPDRFLPGGQGIDAEGAFAGSPVEIMRRFGATRSSSSTKTAPAPGSNVPADGFSARWTGFVTMPTAGTYRYFCSAHGSENSGMRGTVVVQ